MDVAQMYPPRRAEPVDCNGLADPDVGAVRRRVVVTGIGVVTPFGHDVEGFWQALLAGQSCIAPISRLDTSDFPVHFGGQVADVAPTPFLPASLIRRNDLSTNIGLLAGGLALESAGLGALAERRRAISVIVGSAFGAMQGDQEFLRIRRRECRSSRKEHRGVVTMTEEEIRDMLARILVEKLNCSIAVGEVGWDSSLRDDLGIDSLGAAELLFEIEETFGVDIGTLDARSLVTVRDAVYAISRGLQRPAA
jgi:acyl carrier protein